MVTKIRQNFPTYMLETKRFTTFFFRVYREKEKERKKRERERKNERENDSWVVVVVVIVVRTRVSVRCVLSYVFVCV